MSPEQPSFQLGLDGLPVAALVLRGEVVSCANREASELLVGSGGVGDGLVGLCLDDLVSAAEAGIAPIEALRLGTTEGVLLRVHLDGRAVEGRASPTPDGELLVVLVDRSEESRLAAVIDHTSEGAFVIGADGLVTWQHSAPDTNVQEGTGIGLNPIERVHPEDLPVVLDALASALAEPGFRDRYTVRSRSLEDDDTWRTLEVEGVSALDDPDLGGVLVVVRAVDEGERLEHLGPGSVHHSLADTAPIGVVATDGEGRTVYRNPAALSLLGQQAALHTGMEWLDAAPGESRAELAEAVALALGGEEVGPLVVPFGPTDRDEPVWLRVRMAPQGEQDRPSGVVVMLEDVTAEVEARAETSRLTEMLDAMSDYVAVWRPSTGRLLYANAATRRALQRLSTPTDRAQLTDLVADERGLRVVADAGAVLAVEDTWQGEFDMRVAPEVTVPVSALGLSRRRPDGSVDWLAVFARDVSDLKAAQARLQEMATRDSLTGLANRALCNDRLEQAVARHRRSLTGVAVVFCDLDGFKPVNDEHGHVAGDHVLRVVAERLRNVTRAADTVARVGGDEFVVVVEGVASPEELAEVAERIVGTVIAPVTLGGGASVTVGISVGVALATGPAADADSLLSAADAAMYRAKAHGGNGYRLTVLDPPVG